MTDEELKQIAKDLHLGKIFCDRQCPSPQAITQVFMILNFMNEEQLKDFEAKGYDFFYEYLDQAGPMAMNGLPCFFSIRCLTQAETATMLDYYRKYKAALEAV